MFQWQKDIAGLIIDIFKVVSTASIGGSTLLAPGVVSLLFYLTLVLYDWDYRSRGASTSSLSCDPFVVLPSKPHEATPDPGSRARSNAVLQISPTLMSLHVIQWFSWWLSLEIIPFINSVTWKRVDVLLQPLLWKTLKLELSCMWKCINRGQVLSNVVGEPLNVQLRGSGLITKNMHVWPCYKGLYTGLWNAINRCPLTVYHQLWEFQGSYGWNGFKFTRV